MANFTPPVRAQTRALCGSLYTRSEVVTQHLRERHWTFWIADPAAGILLRYFMPSVSTTRPLSRSGRYSSRPRATAGIGNP